MKKYFDKVYRPAMLGAVIEYYDIALYGYMAPILVPVFLPSLNALHAYFCYFLFEVFAAICQIFGARIFGKIGDKSGRKQALYYSILGTSFITFLISILPTYEHIGIYAALLFALCRALQSFFLGGEYNGGAIYCLEHEINKDKHGLVSGLYCAFTVFGVVIAAFIAALIMHFGKEYFRLAYGLSFVLAIYTFYMRNNIEESSEFIKSRFHHSKVSKALANHSVFYAIAITSLFLGILYGLPTRIFNAILPVATGISSVSIMTINVSLLIVYMFLLILSGYLADRFKPIYLMKVAVIATALLAVPLILLIETKLLMAIIIAKLLFTVLAATFTGPLHAWTQSISNAHNRYYQISTSYSLGKIGAALLLPTTIIVFEQYNNLLFISLMLMIFAFITYLKLQYLYLVP